MEGAEEFANVIRAIISEQIAALPMPFHGHIITGSYNAQRGTVSIVRATSSAAPNTGTTGADFRHNVILLTPAYLQQAGPRGGEHCVVFPLPGQHACLIGHETGSSPETPVGEHWLVHDGTSTAVKLTNDGAASGDDLGGAIMQGGGYSKVAAPEVDIIGTTLLKLITATLSASASTSMTFTTPATTFQTASFSISSGTIFCTAGGVVKFVGNAGSTDAEPVLRAIDLIPLLQWLLTHVHGNGNNGGNTGVPTTLPPSPSGSPNFSIA